MIHVPRRHTARQLVAAQAVLNAAWQEAVLSVDPAARAAVMPALMIVQMRLIERRMRVARAANPSRVRP